MRPHRGRRNQRNLVIGPDWWSIFGCAKRAERTAEESIIRDDDEPPDLIREGRQSLPEQVVVQPD